MSKFRLPVALILYLTASFVTADDKSFMGCSWHFPDRFEAIEEGSWKVKKDGYGFIVFVKEQFDEKAFLDSIKSSQQSENVLAAKIVDSGFEISVYNEHFDGKNNIHLPSRIIINNTTGKEYFYLSGMEPEEMLIFISSCMPNIN